MNKNILLGVTGGIAAYKSANICSLLKKNGYNVKIVMTKNATEIITPLTLETLSKNRVAIDMWAEKSNIEVEHISLADWADLVLIAPATYNIIGKVANGIADDMLSTVISASCAPTYFALAMNVNMYNNPILKDNIKKLEGYGYNFIDADSGQLACDWIAKGRLKKETDIVDIVNNHFESLEKEKFLKDKNILITAGPTEEAIDPIRYLSNRSTGKMGYALATASAELGANVTLISGPTHLQVPDGVEFISVKSADDMYEAVFNKFEKMDIAIGCAAVADYRIKKYSTSKIKKKDGDLVFELTRNPDILMEMGRRKKEQTLIGFAAESDNLIENAMKKLEKKNLTLIVANSTSAFGNESNEVFFINKNKDILEIPKMKKKDLAFKILETLK
ncbi:MAG: bifunctional phosphopantothenoylcysteine decarboxylase/phosphopantothenate--cysteine ligase CoaBC [Psychrilyobacter sp.]|uniref:bifunctional phosphopantothenoylcysteine decarboxylase/phosphopantothenate--cysteine ligase CoaBC n=1 Tax=Psychrilyobacter sp. TaxID=2586924 RepID=UPI003C7347BB